MKHKAGLHKEIASIFDGVRLKKKNDTPQPPDAPTTKGIGDEEQQKHDTGRPEPPVPPKPPAPAPKIPEKPKYQQPEPLLSKLVPTEQPQADISEQPQADTSEQPQADTSTKTTRQIPWQQTLEQLKNKLFAPKPGVNAGRQKTMTILVPVLFIVFIFVFIKVLAPSTSKTHASTEPGPSNAIAAPDKEIDWQIPTPYPTTLRNPMQFRPVTTILTGTETATPEFIVKAIVYTEDKPSAIIGTQIVHAGDKVLGATIVKINKDSVEFEMNGKRWTQTVQ